MSAKQDKRARALAFREAKRRGLWKQGESQVYNRWWRRLLRKLFPKYSAKWAAVIGRWYKAQVKRWAKAARAYVHDREAQAFERARAKLERQRRKEALEKFKTSF